MPRISIYVSDDLHARMTAFGANWSAVAQTAFSDHMRNARLLKEVQRQRDAALLDVLSDPEGGDYP